MWTINGNRVGVIKPENGLKTKRIHFDYYHPKSPIDHSISLWFLLICSYSDSSFFPNICEIWWLNIHLLALDRHVYSMVALKRLHLYAWDVSRDAVQMVLVVPILIDPPDELLSLYQSVFQRTVFIRSE